MLGIYFFRVFCANPMIYAYLGLCFLFKHPISIRSSPMIFTNLDVVSCVEILQIGEICLQKQYMVWMSGKLPENTNKHDLEMDIYELVEFFISFLFASVFLPHKWLCFHITS